MLNTPLWRVDLTNTSPLKKSTVQKTEVFFIFTLFSCCHVLKFCSLFPQKVSRLVFLAPVLGDSLTQSLSDTQLNYWDQ